jgi:hypothetical protein
MFPGPAQRACCSAARAPATHSLNPTHLPRMRAHGRTPARAAAPPARCQRLDPTTLPKSLVHWGAPRPNNRPCPHALSRPVQKRRQARACLCIAPPCTRAGHSAFAGRGCAPPSKLFELLVAEVAMPHAMALPRGQLAVQAPRGGPGGWIAQQRPPCAACPSHPLLKHLEAAGAVARPVARRRPAGRRRPGPRDPAPRLQRPAALERDRRPRRRWSARPLPPPAECCRTHRLGKELGGAAGAELWTADPAAYAGR